MFYIKLKQLLKDVNYADSLASSGGWSGDVGLARIDLYLFPDLSVVTAWLLVSHKIGPLDTPVISVAWYSCLSFAYIQFILQRVRVRLKYSFKMKWVGFSQFYTHVGNFNFTAKLY